MMSHLLREHAPITEGSWKLIDQEARERLAPALAARKLVDFAGPKGWQHSATALGRTRALADAPVEGVRAAQRRVLPTVEVRAPFALARSELEDADRGAADIDLDALDEAAGRVARAENRAVFHGWESAGITGIADASAHAAIALGEDCESYPRHVARAVEALLCAGVGGPYGLALGPDAYTAVLETTEHGGYLLFDHLRKIAGGPVVWAPGVQGAVVVSQRGGDFVLEVGEDLSVGYDSHDAEAVQLYLQESFTFRVLTSDAGVALTAPSTQGTGRTAQRTARSSARRARR
jgi:uncharacterized linocin/CFP29 family protein